MSPLTATALFPDHIDRDGQSNSCWPERIVPSVSFWKVLTDDLTQMVREAAFPEYQYPVANLREGLKEGIESESPEEALGSTVWQDSSSKGDWHPCFRQKEALP